MPVSHSSSSPASKAETKRRQASGLGKILATRVRRRNSRRIALQAVGRAQVDTMSGREAEDRKAFRDRAFGPLGKLRMRLAPGFRSGLQEPFGFHLVGRVEDGAQLGGDGLSGLLPGDELSGVLLQMEPTAPPKHCGRP